MGTTPAGDHGMAGVTADPRSTPIDKRAEHVSVMVAIGVGTTARSLAVSAWNSVSVAAAIAFPTRSSIVVLTASDWRGMDLIPSPYRDGRHPTVTGVRLVRLHTRSTS